MRNAGEPLGASTSDANSVAAIIPVYNYGRYLHTAITSVLEQTLPARQIVVVDDGSTDNTRQVAESFGSRLLYAYQQNAGPSAARNHGVRLATSEWVAFLDADDTWMPNKLERVMGAVREHPSACLVYHSFRTVPSDGNVSTTTPPAPRAVWPALRFRNCIGGGSSITIRKDVFTEIGGFDEMLCGCEDWDCWFRAAKRYEMLLVPEPLCTMREHVDNLSLRVESMLRNDEILITKTLVSDLAGIRRTVWRHRVQAAILFRAAIMARQSSRLLAGSLLAGSLLSWPSPLFVPKRWVAFVYWLLGTKGWSFPPPPIRICRANTPSQGHS